MKCFQWVARFACGALIAVFLIASASAQQGLVLSGVGPINRAMGGAATAAPIDAAGAIHWNPASISGLCRSEVTFGMEMILPDTEVSSSVNANSFLPPMPPLPGVPATDLAGSTSGESGVTPVPMVAMVHKPENSRWTYGLGMYGVAGFKVNYPARTDNPILSPQFAQGGLGFGQVNAEAEILQIVPTLSYAVTDRLSIGFAPTVSLARVAVDPLFFAPVNGAGIYPPGRGTRQAWGGGAQVGAYYIGPTGWHLGASIKSPQWFEDVRFFTDDGAGGSNVTKVKLDYPMIVSLGTAYSGFERWLLAVDLRYIDYVNTDGFRESGFNQDGSITGLGYRNTFVVSTGAQFKVNECFYLRAGYVFNENAVRDSDTFFNVPSPLIIQHTVSVGASVHLNDRIILSGVYLHAFENEVTGQYNLPGVGPVPGTEVSSKVSADALGLGMTVRY